MTIPHPDVRAIAQALAGGSTIEALSAPGDGDPGQAAALDRLICDAEGYGAFADLTDPQNFQVLFWHYIGDDGLHFVLTWYPPDQPRRASATHHLRDLVPEPAGGVRQDAPEQLCESILTQIRTILGAGPGAAARGADRATKQLADWLAACAEDGLDPQALIAGGWNRYAPPHAGPDRELPGAPFTLLHAIFAVLDREPQWSAREVEEVAALLTGAGWQLHDPHTCRAPRCAHHYHVTAPDAGPPTGSDPCSSPR